MWDQKLHRFNLQNLTRNRIKAYKGEWIRIPVRESDQPTHHDHSIAVQFSNSLIRLLLLLCHFQHLHRRTVVFWSWGASSKECAIQLLNWSWWATQGTGPLTIFCKRLLVVIVSSPPTRSLDQVADRHPSTPPKSPLFPSRRRSRIISYNNNRWLEWD